MSSTRKRTVSKKKLGNYASSNVVFSIAAALFMIGLFSLFAFYADRLVADMRQHLEVQVELRNDATEEERQLVRETLMQKPYVDRLADTPRIRFVSKEAAIQQLVSEKDRDFLKDFQVANPLKDAFVLNIRESYYQDSRLTQIAQELTALEGVHKVDYNVNLIDEINDNVRTAGLAVALFVSVFFVTVVILINNAIKLALFSQRFLIRSMQLVGATDWFIKRPFVLRAAWQGALSGLAASGLLLALLGFAATGIDGFSEDFARLRNYWAEIVTFMSLAALGSLIGASSAYMAVNRYLRMSLDDLY